LKFARQKGVEPKKYQRIQLPKEPVSTQIPCQFGKEIELAVLKSALLTFDHLLAGTGVRFTRDSSLASVRSMVRAAIMDGDPAKELFFDHVWGIDYGILDTVRHIRDRYHECDPTAFEHILVAAGNAGQRTVDLVWCVFGFEPYRFRLTWSWHGPDFNYMVCSGILKDSPAPTRPFEFSTPLDLGKETRWKAAGRRQEFNEKDTRRFMEELTDRRIAAYKAAVDLVTRTADEDVVESISAYARSLVMDGIDTVPVIDGVKNKLEVLFWDRIQEQSARKNFDTTVGGVLIQVPESRLQDRVVGEDALTDGIDWKFWLDMLRETLDALKPEFGLPGVQTKSGLELDVDGFYELQ